MSKAQTGQESNHYKKENNPDLNPDLNSCHQAGIET